MKVLYFMTAPPNHSAYREMVKGMDHYAAFIQQNEIVWAATLGKQEQIEILGNKVNIIEVPEPPYTLEAIFKQLPKGWEPDAIYFNNADGITLPEDFWESPYPIASMGNDLHVATVHNPVLYDLFDGIVAITTIPEAMQKHPGMFYEPCGTANFPEEIPDILPVGDRPVDILTVCSKLRPVYFERNRTFGTICRELGGKYNICFPSLRDLDIHTPHRYAKIVVDHSFLYVSGRAYEAMINGCVLFTHETNNLISKYLKPFVHYVPYNDDNICDLLEKYINDEALSQAIVDETLKFFEGKGVTHGDMYNHSLKTLLSVTDIEARKKRAAAIPEATKKSALATNLASYTTYWGIPKPRTWQKRYFELVTEALGGQVDITERSRQLLEAARVSLLIDDLPKAKKYLEELTKLTPDLGWAWALFSQSAIKKKDFDSARTYANRAILACNEHPEKTWQIPLPLNVDLDWLMWLAWSSYICPLDPSRRQDQVKACLAFSYKVKADIALKTGSTNEAIESLNQCVQALPIVRDHVFDLAHLMQESGRTDEALAVLEKGLKESPYSYMLIEKKIELLNSLNKTKEADDATDMLTQIKMCYSREYFFKLTGLTEADG